MNGFVGICVIGEIQTPQFNLNKEKKKDWKNLLLVLRPHDFVA